MKWCIALSFPQWETALHQSGTGIAERMTLFSLSVPDYLSVVFSPQDFSSGMESADKRIAILSERLTKLSCDLCDGLPEVPLVSVADGPSTPRTLFVLTSKNRKAGPVAASHAVRYVGYYPIDFVGTAVNFEVDLINRRISTSQVDDVTIWQYITSPDIPPDSYTHLIVTEHEGQKTIWIRSEEKWINTLLQSAPVIKDSDIVVYSMLPALKISYEDWLCALSVYPRRARVSLYIPFSLLSSP